jgi:hypothetical protein
MQTVAIEIDRARARELYREYRKNVHYSKPIDRECMRAYQLLGQGRLIIRALESVKIAGIKTEGVDAGFPKLALCRADATGCTAEMQSDGRCTMHAEDVQPRYRGRFGNSGPIQSRNVFHWPAGSFTRIAHKSRATALVPTPPLHLRPKRGFANYHVLWEAHWTRIVPHDPMLLRRLSRHGDVWLVVAQWELTEVERAVLSGHLIGA